MRIFFVLFLLFISINAFAQNKTIVFFAQSFDGVSAKVIQKIESSDKFCLAVAFDENKYIKKEIQNLILTRKIEPMLNIIEPYFPVISNQINISSSAIFDETQACKDILNSYKKKYPSLKIVIDLHRDSIAQNDTDKVKVTTEINGKKHFQKQQTDT